MILPLTSSTQSGRTASWYVVHTQPNSERRAVRELEAQGFEVFLPRYLKTRRHARRIDTVMAPLFPGYLFVAFDAARARWQSINGTIGVHRLVMAGDGPAPVSPGVVEALSMRADADGIVALAPRAAFHAGEIVRVVGSSFDQCLGLVEGVSEADRVTILLDLLGRKVRVHLGTLDVERAA